MTLKITIKQPNKRQLVVEATLSDSMSIAELRQLWEVEQVLNNLKGSPLRWHVEVTE